MFLVETRYFYSKSHTTTLVTHVRFVGTINEEVVAVTDGFCFYLFSLLNGTVPCYYLSFESFNRGRVEVNHLYYSKYIGYFGTIYSEGTGCCLYRFIFDDVNEIFKLKQVTNHPRLLCGLTAANTKNVFAFKTRGVILNVYNIEENVWSERMIYNGPVNGCIVDVTISKEGEIQALFCQFGCSSQTFTHVLCKLVGCFWEQCHITYTVPRLLRHEQLKILLANDVAFISGGKDNAGVFVNLKVLLLRDITIKKVISCWNCKNSLKSYVDILNLPTLMKRQYFGVT